jgi:hypothetical protein
MGPLEIHANHEQIRTFHGKTAGAGAQIEHASAGR